MMRALIALTVLTAVCLACAPSARAQVGFDRRGHDYMNFSVRSGDPAVCAARCDREARCRAWSFTFPTGDRSATCWLKSEVPPRVKAGEVASGVRGAGVIEPRAGDLEYSIDRLGGDYRSFETTPDPKAKACADACKAENRCRAWTYRRAGYGVTVPHCYLKDTIKPPRHRPCCISGVVR